MLNTIVLIAYLIALAVFALLSVLAIRHTVKFGYISQKFKALGWAFGILAVAIIIFSIILMVNLFKSDSGGLLQKSSTTNIDY